MAEEQKDLKEEEINTIMFMNLIYSFQNIAIMQLGKVVNPATNKIDKNLDQAKGTIDLIRALKAKTKGNLNKQEADFLDQVIYTLQLNYADEATKSEKEKSTTQKADEKTTN